MELDIYTFNTVLPSLALIAVMIVAMTWGYFKVRKLMDDHE